MTGLLAIFAALVLVWCVGVCIGASSVEEVNGELRLPSGWWIAPIAVFCGLSWGAFLGWAL